MDILVANKIIVYFRFVDNVLIAYDYTKYRNYEKLIRLPTPRCYLQFTRLPKRRMGRDNVSVQGLASGWKVRGSNPGGDEIFRTHPDRPWGPPCLLYNGYRVSFPGVKRPGHGVDHPPHLALRLKKEYSYSSTPLLGLRGLF